MNSKRGFRLFAIVSTLTLFVSVSAFAAKSTVKAPASTPITTSSEISAPAASTASPVAPAAPVATTKKSGAEQIAELKSMVAGKLRMGLSINTASTISGLSTKSAGTSTGLAEANTETTPGLDIMWAKPLYAGPGATKFDWFVGVNIERERALSSLNVKALGGGSSQTVIIDQNVRPTFHTNLFTAGLRWTPTERVFVPVGLNYGFLSQASWGSNGTFNMDPSIGLTAGIGMKLTPSFELEAAYKTVRYSMSLRALNFAQTGNAIEGSVDLSGAVMSGRYIF